MTVLFYLSLQVRNEMTMMTFYLNTTYSSLAPTGAFLSLSLNSRSKATSSLTVSSRPCTSSSRFRMLTDWVSNSSCPTTAR